MNVIFRVDASFEIGNGHVMRCLTLAIALVRYGAQCNFICRDLPGNLIDLIRSRGFNVDVLPAPLGNFPNVGLQSKGDIDYSLWLGVDPETDWVQTRMAIKAKHPDCLVVDHYGLNKPWESAARALCHRLIVIDDLVDRFHDCDFLINQNFGTTKLLYEGLVPSDCKVLAGERYALLRREFAEFRSLSLLRRGTPLVRNILITMGGVDQKNITTLVLRVIDACNFQGDIKFTVVMGPNAPWLDDVRNFAERMSKSVYIRVNVENMAGLMAESDLAIAAAGSTTWELCCLGVPAIMIVLADNQRETANRLQKELNSMILEITPNFEDELKRCIEHIINNTSVQISLSKKSRRIIDGLGSNRVASAISDGA